MPKIIFLLVFILMMSSCTKEDTQETLDSTKELSGFDLKKADGSLFASGEIKIEVQSFSIKITLPYTTNRNGLIPVFTIKGKTVSPQSGIAQNFNVPVVYTVTAEDGSTASYTVTVELGPAPDAIVYFGSSNNKLYAVNANTGALIWNYTSTASFVYSSPTYQNGVLFVGGIDNYVYAFNATNGSVIWKKLIATTGIESDAVVANGTIYVGTNDDRLFALDAATGNEKWSFLTGGNISSSPVVNNNTVYFGSSDGRFYALDENTGAQKWSYQTGGMINQSGASLVNNTLYFGSRDGSVYALNATNGSLIWKFNSTNNISFEASSPTVSEDFVYIGGWYDMSFSKKGSFYKLNAATGNLIWEKLNNTGFSSSPFLTKEYALITGDDLKLHCLSAQTGESIWNKQILANSASPLVWANTVYVGGGGTRAFYAFDLATGNQKWKFDIPDALMTSSPLVVVQNNDPVFSADSGMKQ
jgi:eukaryotic-like serine/threonine-protein kinase